MEFGHRRFHPAGRPDARRVGGCPSPSQLKTLIANICMVARKDDKMRHCAMSSAPRSTAACWRWSNLGLPARQIGKTTSIR